MVKITAYDWFNNQVRSVDLYENRMREKIEKKNLNSFLLHNSIFEDIESPLKELLENESSYSDLRVSSSKVFKNVIALNETKHVLLRIENLCNDLIREVQNFDMSKLNQEIKIESDNIEKLEKEFNIQFELYVSIQVSQENLASIFELSSGKYLITVSYKGIRKPHELREAISHELVHLVETCITHVKPSYVDIDPESSNMEYFVDNYLYIFSKQEINARLTELYYALHDVSDISDVFRAREELEKKVRDFKERSEERFGYISPENTPVTEIKLTKNYWKIITLYDKMISYFYILEKLNNHDKKQVIKILRDRINKTGRNQFRISPKGNPLEDFERLRRKSERIIKAYTRKIRGVFELIQ